MMQLPSTPPITSTSETCLVGILQHLQQLVEHPRQATLADAQMILVSMQREYGATATLEQIIQVQVGRLLQMQRRQKVEVLR